ncbi:MAG: heavy-metal-associated domain-containing protein [Coriobacteriales bacterium]|nr:heavy-metal-associated domain-containing protein [Coriobacteriales bacterium]
MATTVIRIDGMTCGHCTSAVEETLGELAGVESVVADLDSASATIQHDGSVDEAVMRALLEQIGFELP